MATYTKNLNLVKPDMNDPVSPKPFNENADILDEKISEIAGSSGYKWNLINTYNFSSSSSSILIPKADIPDFYPYDEIMICLQNADINVTSSEYTVHLVSNGSHDICKYVSGSVRSGYATCQNLIFKFIVSSYDPLNGVKVYRIENPFFTAWFYGSGGLNHIELCETTDVILNISNATFTCRAKVYGRAWAFPGD